MERIDDLLDAGIPVVEVEVEDVDVVGAEVLERAVDSVPQGLGAVSRVGGAGDGVGGEVEVVRVLGGDNELVADSALLSPLSDELLGGSILAISSISIFTQVQALEPNSLEPGGIDEVTARLPEGVEELEAAVLSHLAHAHLGPGTLSDAHTAELQGGDVDSGALGQLAQVAELGGGRVGWDEGSHIDVLGDD